MKYAAIIEYTSDTELIGRIRPTHREYLTGLKDSGKLAAAGPFTDDSGALIIYEAESPEEAETLIQNDPFSKNGIFLKYTVRPWKTVMANLSLFPG